MRSLENCSDSYALAVSAYALQLANHASKSDALSRLKQLAQSNGKEFHPLFLKKKYITVLGINIRLTLNGQTHAKYSKILIVLIIYTNFLVNDFVSK